MPITYLQSESMLKTENLLHQKPNITAQEIEDNFDGNICRCTGYRLILNAMKSFDGSANLPGAKTIDFEDLNKNVCPRTGELCTGEQHGHKGGTRNLSIDANGVKWFRSMSHVGCIDGNLMIKHAHPDFPSDIFTILENLSARVDIYDIYASTKKTYSLLEFLKEVNMTGKIILAVQLSKLAENEIFKSFKITPRSQNAHAYVNAAFRIKVENHTIKDTPSIVYGGISADTVHALKTEAFLTNKTLSSAVVKGETVLRMIVFHGKLERILDSVNFPFISTEAIAILKDEMKPEYDQLPSSPTYRQDLAVSLFYKVLLGIYSPSNSKLRSGMEDLHRPISSGLQTYQEMTREFPVKQPMPKKTAPLQASGEAQFVNDIPTFLFGAFVLSDVGPATIEALDATEALKMPGLFAFLTAKDKPEGGSDNYLTSALSFPLFHFQGQELFATKETSFCGQQVGLILAETQSLAYTAAKKVNVSYSEEQNAITNLDDSIKEGKEFEFMKEFVVGQPDEAWSSVDKVVEGECRLGSQYHFYMETQVSLAVPSEDGLDLYSSTQFADMTQQAAAEIIGAVPSALVTETVMEHMAKTLNLHPIIAKELNLYKRDKLLHTQWREFSKV